MSVSRGLRAERLIARRYEDLGYAVTTEPPVSAIPFDLGGYQPDILATKDNDYVILEVKSPGSRPNPERYLSIAREVSRHPGWRFLLVTVSENELNDSDRTTPGNLSHQALREHLLQLDRLSAAAAPVGLIFPYLWVAYVSALRLNLGEADAAQGLQTDLSVINRAYSEGVISIEEHETARRLLTLRNDAVHSLNPVVAEVDIQELRKLTERSLRALDGAGEGH